MLPAVGASVAQSCCCTIAEVQDSSTTERALVGKAGIAFVRRAGLPFFWAAATSLSGINPRQPALAPESPAPFLSLTPGPPPFSAMNSIPPPSRVRRTIFIIACRRCAPFLSNWPTSDTPICAAEASCRCDQSRSARAARHWAGVIIGGARHDIWRERNGWSRRRVCHKHGYLEMLPILADVCWPTAERTPSGKNNVAVTIGPARPVEQGRGRGSGRFRPRTFRGGVTDTGRIRPNVTPRSANSGLQASNISAIVRWCLRSSAG